MISTHTPKMFNARIKSLAISSRIISISESLICSKTTNMRKEFWAAPDNAAFLKNWRETVAKLPDDFTSETSLPKIMDPHLKQLLIPIDWRNDQYISVTPVSSMGLMHELYKRVYEQNIPFREWTIQPNSASIANHGEALLMQAGTVRLLRRGLSKIQKGKWRGDFVQMTARCEGMNISSGMIATGFPAISAVGGFIHTIERKTGLDLEFAIGFNSIDWIHGVPKIVVHKGSHGSSVSRVKGKKVKIQPGYSTEEIKANCEIVLLINTKTISNSASNSLIDCLESAHRLAGGALFDVETCIVRNGAPANASYLLDASIEITRKSQKENIDNLQSALDIYSKNAKWTDKGWYQPKNGYTLNQTGFAFLERPSYREGSRGNYKHAWCEPAFSLITQGSMTENCWWHRKTNNAGAFWEKALNNKTSATGNQEVDATPI